MEKYLKDKIFLYCDEKKEKGIDFTAYNVSEDLKNEWWNIAIVFYGEWLNQNSKDFKTVELSQQEW